MLVVQKLYRIQESLQGEKYQEHPYAVRKEGVQNGLIFAF
jgi:hypothetical protein